MMSEIDRQFRGQSVAVFATNDQFWLFFGLERRISPQKAPDTDGAKCRRVVENGGNSLRYPRPALHPMGT